MKTTGQREKIIDSDLKAFHRETWGLYLPFRDYTLRFEDTIPALAGAIGKVSLVAAFALAWAEGYAIAFPGFAAENVRLELFLASVILIIFSAFFHPRLSPPGTLAPLISMIPFMVELKVHPLTLGILIGIFGLVLSLLKAFPRIVALNSSGTRGGILVLFGILGTRGSIISLWKWSSSEWLFSLVIAAGIIVFLLLVKIRKAWLTIPLCLAAGLLVSALFGQLPVLSTSPGMPLLNGTAWWQERWNIGNAFNLERVAAALPFALLAVIMWPLDATAIQTMHQRNYYPYGGKVMFDLNASFLIISLRNLLGSLLGGAQTAAVWRSYLIPLGVVRRPIPGSALLLGIFCLVFALTGYPIDLAMFPPMLHLVLIFGVFVPMFLTGLLAVTSVSSRLLAVCVIIPGILVHPLVGWIFGILLSKISFFREGPDNFSGQ